MEASNSSSTARWMISLAPSRASSESGPRRLRRRSHCRARRQSFALYLRREPTPWLLRSPAIYSSWGTRPPLRMVSRDPLRAGKSGEALHRAHLPCGPMKRVKPLRSNSSILKGTAERSPGYRVPHSTSAGESSGLSSRRSAGGSADVDPTAHGRPPSGGFHSCEAAILGAVAAEVEPDWAGRHGPSAKRRKYA